MHREKQSGKDANQWAVRQKSGNLDVLLAAASGACGLGAVDLGCARDFLQHRQHVRDRLDTHNHLD